MRDSLNTHARKGTGSREGNREQGAGNRDLGHPPARAHQATQSGASSCGYVDNNEREPQSLAHLLESVAQQYTEPRISQQRHEVIRSGERRVIPRPVRLAVLLRDLFRCGICGFSVRRTQAHLDHIHPWSAGGLDTTANLRTTCPACNMQRSNHIDADEAPRQAATFWCDGCVGTAAFVERGGEMLWTFKPHPGHSCWFCEQDWWMALHVAPRGRPDDSPFAAVATPVHLVARCLHCKVETETRWSL